jgi:biotin-(acetyl-CoA carboxylase) ligase
MRLQVGACIDVNVLLATLFQRLQHYLKEHTHVGLTALLDELRRRSATLGQSVHVVIAGRRQLVRAIDLDAHGALLVEDAQGQCHRILDPLPTGEDGA